MRDKNGKILGALKSEQVGPFGGGFVTSFGITDDAKVMVHGTDVGGGYVWGEDDQMWRHAVSYESYPALDTLKDTNGYSDADGCYAIDIAPSNGQVGYCVFRARLFKTTDQFKTVQYVQGGYFGAKANTGVQRLFNDKLKIDPVDPNTFMVGSEGQGVFYSIDGGTTLVKVSGIPTVTATSSNYPLPILVAVDRTSATANGRKQKWAIWVPGSGIWETTTGPEGAWTKSTTPTTNFIKQMSFDWNGNLLLSTGSTGILERQNGTWTAVSAFQAAATAVLKNDQKISMGENGDMNFTIPSAPNTWNADRWYPHYPLKGGIQYKADKVRWLASPQVALFPSKLMPDPVDPAKVWLVHGTGIAWAKAPADFSSPIIWNDMSMGNAMLVTNRTAITPEGNLLRGSWDQPIWTGVTDEEINNPLTHRIPEAFTHGWDVDYVPGKSNIIVACANYQSEHSGMSKDGGETFTNFAPHPLGATLGGNIGFVSETEGYWIPSNDGKAVYTTDGGQNWSILELTAKDGSQLPLGGGQGWSFAYYVNKKNLMISKEEPGVAYLYNNGPDAAPGLRGFWRKEAGSTTFNQVCAGNIGGNGWFHWYMSIIETPGMVGDLIMTPGGLAEKPVAMRSTDAGKTWTQIKTKLNGVEYPLVNIETLGWGKNAPGSPFKTARFSGLINDDYGIYESIDNLQTVTKVESHPAGMTYGCSGIAGHPLKFGEWYYGVGQMGWARATRRHVLRFS